MAESSKVVWLGITKVKSIPTLRKIRCLLKDQINECEEVFMGVSNGDTPLLSITAFQNFDVEIIMDEFFDDIMWGDGFWLDQTKIAFYANTAKLVNLLDLVLERHKILGDLKVTFALHDIPNNWLKLFVSNVIEISVDDPLVVVEDSLVNSHAMELGNGLNDFREAASEPSPLPTSYVDIESVRKLFNIVRRLYGKGFAVKWRCEVDSVIVHSDDGKKGVEKRFKLISGDGEPENVDGEPENVEWNYDYERFLTIGGPRFLSGAPQPDIYLYRELMVTEFRVAVRPSTRTVLARIFCEAQSLDLPEKGSAEVSEEEDLEKNAVNYEVDAGRVSTVVDSEDSE